MSTSIDFIIPAVTGVKVGKLTAKEYDDISDIEKKIYGDNSFNKFPKEGVSGRYHFNDEDFVWFVMKKDQKVVAYAIVDVDTNYEDFVYLYDLAVDPSHQGAGHATNILGHVVRWKERHGKKMYLKVHSKNEIAKKLYESAGFNFSEERPNMPILDGYVFMRLD